MQTKLDAVQHNIEDWTAEVTVMMNARTATLAAANAELDRKIRAAGTQFLAPRRAYEQESKLFKRKVWPSKKAREAFQKVTNSYEQAKKTLIKLEKAKEMIAALQRDDELRLTEISVQNNKIIPLWNDLNAKLGRGEAFDDRDKDNLKKIETAHDYIAEIHKRIRKNTQHIDLCHRLATAYDETHPEQFPGHWLNFANVIVEQQDVYGFRGEVDQQDLHKTQAIGSGLEGYSTSYGAVLKSSEIVSYTLPGTKIHIEQDANGRIVDKTPSSVDNQHKALAAIKMANLLLIDREKHPEKAIHLQGNAETLQQAYLIIAALQVQARLAGMNLSADDIIINIPGWTNWRGSTINSMQAVTHYEGDIENIIRHYHGQDDLKAKLHGIRNNSIMVDEPIHSPRKY